MFSLKVLKEMKKIRKTDNLKTVLGCILILAFTINMINIVTLFFGIDFRNVFGPILLAIYVILTIIGIIIAYANIKISKSTKIKSTKTQYREIEIDF